RVPGELRRAGAVWEARDNPKSKLLSDLNDALNGRRRIDRAKAFESAGVHAFDAGKRDEAVRWSRESVALDPLRPLALKNYADLLATSGRPLGAKLAWAELADMPGAPPEWREDARKKAAADPR